MLFSTKHARFPRFPTIPAQHMWCLPYAWKHQYIPPMQSRNKWLLHKTGTNTKAEDETTVQTSDSNRGRDNPPNKRFEPLWRLKADFSITDTDSVFSLASQNLGCSKRQHTLKQSTKFTLVYYMTCPPCRHSPFSPVYALLYQFSCILSIPH